MTSHVEAEIQRRLARVRAEAERKRLEREELAEARRYGLEARKRQKLRNLARSQQDPAVVRDSLSPANGTSLHSVEAPESIRPTDGTPDNRTLAASGAR